MKSVEKVSLLEFLFSGQVLTSIFMVFIFILGALMLYSFFVKYFYLKDIYSKENDFLANIADCIYDHRIEAAKDWCKRTESPESRIVKKGLDKIEKSSFEIFVSVSSQRDIEILEMRKNLFKFGLLSKIIFLLGFVGTGVALVLFFIEDGQNFSSKYFYTALFPISIGALLSLLVYLFKLILVSLIYKIEVNLKGIGNKFLEIIAESK